MENYQFVKKQGLEILDLVNDFAQLRITVFKEFPYLYEGSVDYEKQYIQTYANSPNAFVFAAYHQDKMVGATTCIPLKDETPNVIQPFLDAQLPIQDFMYFGESLVLKEHRGNGLGHRFFDERETFAKSINGIEMTAFCAVNRKVDHSLRPTSYVPNDRFWMKRGYQKRDDLVCEMSWQDVDEKEESLKTLTFWTKEL